jgi:carboxyl-terminal processing protease
MDISFVKKMAQAFKGPENNLGKIRLTSRAQGSPVDSDLMTQSLVSRRWSLLSFALLAWTGSTVFSTPTWAGKLQCRQLPELFEAYLANHYSFKEMSDSIRTKTIEQFIKRLDPSKTTLLQSDVDQLKKSLPNLFKTMRKGDCSTLVEAHQLVLKRTTENEAFVKTVVGKDYKLDDTISITLDPEKRGYAKSQAEKDALIRAMVHFQISNYLLANPSLDKAKTQLAHRYELITKRVKEQKSGGGAEDSDMTTTFAEAFALALDPHTTYLSQENMEDFQIQMQLSLEGIGVSLSSQDGYVVVEEIIPGGSADRAGSLKPQDKIVAVTQEGKSEAVTTIDMDLRDVVKMIRGKKGTKVILTILRQAEKTETLKVTLARDKVDLKDAAVKLTMENRDIGGKKSKIAVIDLPSFYGGREKGSRSGYKDMKDAIEQAKKSGAEGIVLDLSRNGGGLLEDAVRISGLFIKKGPIVATQDTQRRKDILSDEDPETQWTGPLVVLTSRVSASASEILSGALQDYRRALIVGGDHTFGKGTVQVLSGLPMDLGAMKVTTGMYFLPKGKSTQHQGVLADITLPSLLHTDDIGEKSLDYSLPPVAIDNFLGKEGRGDGTDRWMEIQPDLVKRLSDSSKKRVEKDPKFVELKKDFEEMQKNRGTVKLADLRKKSEAEKKKDDKDKLAAKKKRGEDSPQLAEAVNIMGEWISSLPRTLPAVKNNVVAGKPDASGQSEGN